MLPHLIPAAEMIRLPKYDRITVLLFRELTKDFGTSTLPEVLAFSKEQVVEVMSKAVKDGIIDSAVKNVADIKYTYDARKDLPVEVEQAGHFVWLGTRKSHYRFERTSRRNLITLPLEPGIAGAHRIREPSTLFGNLEHPPPHLEHVMDQTPPSIAALLGNDEQAAFTRVRNAGILTSFLGFQVWPIQGHQRTSVSFGQVEIDEVHAGMAPGRKLTIVPISGKGGQDKLSFSQALSLNTFGAEKFRKHKVAVRSLGLWRDKHGHIWLVEFSPHTNIHQIEIVQVRRFEIT